MGYIPSISNDDVAALEAIHFDGKIEIVESIEQLKEACEVLSATSIIGFDTETRPSFRAGVSYKVSLLQLSTPEVCYLFRLCSIRLSNALLKILGSRQILKVGVDVGGDIRALQALRHFKADGFVDLQVEAPRWGIEEKSLRKLSAIVLGMRISKAQRLSNWEAGILTEQQQEYAATDAWVSMHILERMMQEEPKEGNLTIIAAQEQRQKEEAQTPHHRRRHPRRRAATADKGADKRADKRSDNKN
jgi:ribonuclease D